MARFSAGTLLAGIMAVLFGLLGAYVVRKQLNRPAVAAAQKPAGEATSAVPVAASDLPVGRKITLGDIGIMRLTSKQLRERGFNKPFMANTQQIIGRVIREPMKRGTTFDPTNFYPEGMGPDVAEKLMPGYRAVTVKVEMTSAVAGFVSPGSFVDVLFRSEKNVDEDFPEMTIPLIGGVEVLALDKETLTGARTGAPPASVHHHSVTLAVRPEQAAALQVVSGRGELSLALRNPEDTEEYAFVGPRTLDDLLERQTRRHKIEVYRGRGMSQVEFRRNDRLTPTAPVLADVKPGNFPAPLPPLPPSSVPVEGKPTSSQPPLPPQRP